MENRWPPCFFMRGSRKDGSADFLQHISVVRKACNASTGSLGCNEMNPVAKTETERAVVSVQQFIKHHYRHFNAAVVVDASDAYREHIAQGGKMLLAMAGAMSTAELGLSLAEMIRQDKVHAI